MVNQYTNPYVYNPMQQFQQSFPQQQIPTANGRASVDNIRLAPNSSVLIADSCNPIIYKCVSDSLGNVTTEAFDVTKHKDEEQVKKEQTELILADLVARIERLENESNTKRNSTENEYGSTKANVEYAEKRKQPTGYTKPNDAKQS